MLSRPGIPAMQAMLSEILSRLVEHAAEGGVAGPDGAYRPLVQPSGLALVITGADGGVQWSGASRHPRPS